ncbi:MAG: Dabb family protein [Planctomycetes bacterium]|nr:Dabb family protein [Planctomycetota bacterium]
MVEHLVLLKLKAGTPDSKAKAMLDAVRALKGRIDGIVELTAGPNYSDRSKGFTHGIMVRFRDPQALARYLPHPIHQQVVSEQIKPILDEVIVVDYEF